VSTLTFDSIAKSAMAASAILTDEHIAVLQKDRDYAALQCFLYRIASYAVAQIRHAEEGRRSDEDYIDALQECALAFPAVLARYDASQAKLTTYAQRTFRRIAVLFLATQERGGMVKRYRTLDCPPVQAIEDEGIDDGADPDEDLTWLDTVVYPVAPVGYDDPMKELIAQDSVTAVLSAVPDRAMAARLREELGRIEK
jgi:hypothetical protein